MAAIPIIVFDQGFVHINKGSLINPPTEFFSAAQKSFYSNLKAGWSRCPLGYSVYCAIDALGRKLVIPGILDQNERAPNRKFPNYPLRFSRAQIENFAKPHLMVTEKIREERNSEFQNLTHDLRAISNEIYHGALSARELIYGGEIEEKINLIINAQQMMSIRLDVIDYESGFSSERPKEYFFPFKKTEKVVKCFEGKLRARRISCNLDGRNWLKVYGPPIFEIVPFVIVENALKYAPTGTDVLIRFTDDEEKVLIRFESLGPKINEKEKKKIFDKSYRGEAVQQSGRSGSGIGLFAARTIIQQHFDGKIFVNQVGNPLWIDGHEFYQTRFTIVLPAKNDDSERR